MTVFWKDNRALLLLSSAGLFLIVALGAANFLGIDKILSIAKDLNPLLIPLFALLTAISLCLRILRWKLLLESSGARLSLSDAAVPFLNATSVSLITPARIGELLRVYLTKKRSKVPLSKSLGPLLLERLFDFLSLLVLGVIFVVLLALEGKEANPAFSYILYAVAGLLFLAFSALFFPPLRTLIFKRLLNDRFSLFLSHLRKGLTKRPGQVGLALTIPIWICEFSRTYAIMSALGGTAPFLSFSGAIAISILAGVVSAIPGGIGVSEITSITILSYIGLSPALSGATVFLDRLLGFWPTILVGIAISPSLFFARAKVKN